MFEKLNEKIRNLTVADIGSVKLSVFFATIIIVKLFSELLKINYRILIILMIACASRALYKIWIKK